MTALFQTTGASGSPVGTATITAAGDLLTIAGHGLVDGQQVVTSTPTGGAVGVLVEGAPYFVASATTDTFQIRPSPGGPVMAFATDGGCSVDIAAAVNTAQDLRQAMGGLLYKARDAVATDLGRFGARWGVLPNGSTDEVTLAGSTITIEDLNCIIVPAAGGTQGGPYIVALPTHTQTVTPADGSDDRLDILIAEVLDDAEDTSGDIVVQTRVIDGTPAGIPVAPDVPEGTLRLATIDVPQGGAPTLDYDAQEACAAGGILVVADEASLPTIVRRSGAAAFVRDTRALVIWDGSAWTPAGSTRGFQYGATVTYTSSGSFTKASYPGLRAVRLRCQGGGGAGGGAPTTSGSQCSSGSGGQAGGYAEAWILASALSASETVTIGTGGAGVAGTIGGDGGTTSVGTHCVAPGGKGGVHAAASSTVNGIGQSTLNTSGTGDLVIPGEPGGASIHSTDPNAYQQSGFGGRAHWGMGGQGRRSSTGADGYGGIKGGGGGGSANGISSAARIGAAGGAGEARIDLYY